MLLKFILQLISKYTPKDELGTYISQRKKTGL